MSPNSQPIPPDSRRSRPGTRRLSLAIGSLAAGAALAWGCSHALDGASPSVGSGPRAPLKWATETTAPVELGTIAWERNYEAGRERARAEKLPILLLFQEVPG